MGNVILNDWQDAPTAKPTTRPNAGRRAVRGSYDAAQTTEDNRKHWAAADALSAVTANSQSVRRSLRNRSRYEVANNCYARGIIDTMAAYTIGTGPTLQLVHREQYANQELTEAAQIVEQHWANWAEARGLSQKLTTAAVALNQDGEAFGLMTTARRPSFRTPVTLNVRLYEADQFEDPLAAWAFDDDSGIRLDASGEPIEYAMLRSHPGDAYSIGDLQADWKPADQVLHLYRCDRPGQLRGIPRTTPALPLFALLRRFTLATVVAAETAADFAAILYGDQPADMDAPAVEAWDRVEIERGALLTAPEGSRIAQLKAEHPNATYDEFVKSILREIARCLGVPAVVALGDASNYNYSSGRLDLQSFNRAMACERAQIFEAAFLDRLWTQWLDEALLIDGFLPEAFKATAGEWSVGWRWSEPEHVDRQKEAMGQQTEIQNNTTTLAREYSRRGLDWETELRQRAKEIQLMRELGLSQQPQDSNTDGTNEQNQEPQPAA